MADLSLIRSTLKTWVETTTGLDAYWRGRPRPQHFGNSYVLIGLGSPVTVGNDMNEVEYDDTAAAGEEIRQYQGGQRQFTFTAQVRSMLQSDDVDALHYTSLIRNRTHLPSSVAAFKLAEISFARILAETPITGKIDNRLQSVAQIDILINAKSLVEDTATGYIETLEDFEFQDAENPAPPLWTGDIDIT